MSTESPKEEGTRQSNRQPPNITTYSGREPINFCRTREENKLPNRDSDNDSPVSNLALTSTTTPFTMVVFDAKLDYVLKDLLGVPIDTETNPTRLAFEEEAIHSWWKFIKLPTSFIDSLRYLEDGIPKYPAKSIIIELQSIRNFRHHLIRSNNADAHNPQSWDTSVYVNWVAYDEQSFLAGLSGTTSTGTATGTTAVTTTTFNSNSDKLVAATVQITGVDGKGIPINTPTRPPPPPNACIESNNTEDSGTRPLNQEAEATASASTKRTMVTTTVVDGEVIPVENTPPRPPPLPEPPPPYNNFTGNSNEDSQRRLHSISSTDIDGPHIPLVYRQGLPYIKQRRPADIELTSLPHVIMTSESRWDPRKYDDSHLSTADTNFVNNNILSVTKVYQPQYFVNDKNFADTDGNNILSMTKFYQPRYFVNDKIFADADDNNILSMTKSCQPQYFVNDKNFADADDIFYDCLDPNNFIEDIHIDRTSIEPYNNWRTMDNSTTRLIHQGIRDNCATCNIKAGEFETTLHPILPQVSKPLLIDYDIIYNIDSILIYAIIKRHATAPEGTTTSGELIMLLRLAYREDRIYDIEDPKNSYDNCHATAPEGTTISGELIMLFRLAYQVDRMYCTIAAITQQVFLHQDIHNDNGTIAMIMQLVVLFQVKYKMRSFVREDDDTIADVHDSKFNNLYIDDRCWYSTTPTDEEILLFQLIYQVQVQGQAKYEMIRPIYLICSNGNGNFSTSIDGEKYASQLKYKDDNTIAVMQLVVLLQDVHEADNTITFIQKALFQDTHINDETIAIMQLLVLYAVVPYHRIFYRMKLTQTMEDSSSTNNKKTEDQINSNTATIDICDNDDTIANMQLVALYHDKDIIHNIDSIFNCPFDIINGNAKLSTSIYGQKYTSQDYYTKEYQIKYKTLQPFHLIYHGDKTMNDHGNYCSDTRKNGERTTRYSNEDPYMIQYHDIITVIDATYDCNSNDTTITTSIITYYCTEQIWMKNNNYNNIRFYDGNHCNYIMKKNGEKKRLEERYQSRALRSEGQYKDEVYNAEEGMFQEPITIKDLSYSNIANINIDFHNDKMKENGEQTTCYSNQDPCMIIAIDSKDNIDMIATEASLRLGHSNEGKININTSFNTKRDETTTLIRTATSTSIGNETTTLTSTDQNGENSERLGYNLVIVLTYDHVILMIPVRLCSCILLIVTMRLLSQSMGSVKIHKRASIKTNLVPANKTKLITQLKYEDQDQHVTKMLHETPMLRAT